MSLHSVQFLFLGLNVTEVAHDFYVGVQKYVTDDLGLVNSYDTWHGMIESVF